MEKETVVYVLKRNKFEKPTTEEIIKHGKKFSLKDYQEAINENVICSGNFEINFVYFSQENKSPDHHMLRREVEIWFERTFNYIDQEVMKSSYGEDYHLYQEKILDKTERWLKDYWLYDIQNQNKQDLIDSYIQENNLSKKESKAFKNLSDDEILEHEDFIEWLKEQREFESYLDDKRDDNYPMWNTLFEFRHQPSQEQIDILMDSNLVVIEESDYFNVTIGVAGAGYDFYDAHWIPLYLSFYEDRKKFYEPILKRK